MFIVSLSSQRHYKKSHKYRHTLQIDTFISKYDIYTDKYTERQMFSSELTNVASTQIKKQNITKTPGASSHPFLVTIPLPTFKSDHLLNFCFHKLDLPSFEFCVNEIMPGIFHLASCLQDSPTWWHVVVVHSCSLLFSIPLCECATIYPSTVAERLGYFHLGLL